MIHRSQYGFVYGHGGFFPGYQTEMEYVPELKCAFVIQVNADPFSGKIKGSLAGFISEFFPIIYNYIRKKP